MVAATLSRRGSASCAAVRGTAWLLLLSACSSTPPTGGPAVATPDAASTPTAAAKDRDGRHADATRLWTDELAQRALALEAQEQFALALVLWDAQQLLRPQDTTVRDERERLQTTIKRKLVDYLKRGAAAERRADWQTAEQAYLAALSLQPDHTEAARALRALEVRRTPKSSRPDPGAPSAPAYRPLP
jgi:tetratricopeptide (TPR) repeat protein